MGLALLFLFLPLPFALISAVRKIYRCVSDSDHGIQTLGLILISTFVMASATTVIPHWLNRGLECYRPSIFFSILTVGNVALFFIAALVGKFGEDSGDLKLRSVGASAMLAIPVTFGLLLLVNDILIQYFNITLVN